MYRKDLIRSKIVEKNLNLSSFAKASDLGKNTARKLWNGELNITLPLVKKASEFLGIPIPELFSEKPANRENCDSNDQSISS